LGLLGLFLFIAELLLFFIKILLCEKLKYIITRFYIAIILVISNIFSITIELITSYILLFYPFVLRTRGYFLTKTDNTKGKFYLFKFLFRASRYYNRKKEKL
jgi:hypothetical protein